MEVGSKLINPSSQRLERYLIQCQHEDLNLVPRTHKLDVDDSDL